MTDIKSPRLLYVKGALMLLTGILAGTLVISQAPSVWTALLLSIAIWGFCRAYYFAFYVIEHYVDPGYKFSGLIDFFRYCLGLHPQSTSEPRGGGDERPSRGKAREPIRKSESFRIRPLAPWGLCPQTPGIF
jgi:hypothetical protein